MFRFSLRFVLIASIAAPSTRADTFDLYTNPLLALVPEAKGVKELKQLTPALLTEHDQVLPDANAAFVVVRTNDNRFAKLLVQTARRKIDADKSVPILLIDRFVTYRDGEEQAIQATGKNMNLFGGFRLNLDIGQVVPEQLPADLRFVVEEGKTYVEPVGKAKLYLLTQQLPEAAPKKTDKVVIGETFLPSYFAGTYKLHDDGRRSGTLKLTVSDEGIVEGAYYSDKDGARYDVTGSVGKEKHSIVFIVKLPRTEQTFQGWMFTGDGKVIAGSSKFQSRETGFYAERVEK